MVIMARARQSRKQWRPKAVIQSAAAQHRSNANHLVSSILQDRHDSVPPTCADETLRTTSKKKSKAPLSTITEGQTLNNNNALNNERNALMLQLSTAVLSSSNIRPSINITSSSGDVLDDDERDEIALFVQQQSEKFKNKNSNNNNNSDHHHHHHQLHDENENPIEILPSTSLNSKDKIEQNCKSKTNNRSSQTENHLPCHYPAKRMKTRLKEETNSDGTSITASNITDNTGKIAKRKAYSRMKKERKATQTLIIVLSKCEQISREYFECVHKCQYDRMRGNETTRRRRKRKKNGFD